MGRKVTNREGALCGVREDWGAVVGAIICKQNHTICLRILNTAGVCKDYYSARKLLLRQKIMIF